MKPFFLYRTYAYSLGLLLCFNLFSQVQAQEVGSIVTLVGGASPHNGMPDEGVDAKEAVLVQPGGIAIDPFHNLYVADTLRNVVRKVSWQGSVITTFAGTGDAGYAGDGGPATQAQLHNPTGLATDREGNLYIADTANDVVRKVDVNGIMTTVAGGGVASPLFPLSIGDGGPATQAVITSPYGLEVDDQGSLYISSLAMNRVRKVTPDGFITTVAGNGEKTDESELVRLSGDDGPAVDARLDEPRDLALDSVGNLYISDSRNFRVRRVDARTGIITTVAGRGPAGRRSDGPETPAYPYGGFSGDGGPAMEAQLDRVEGLAVDSEGTLFIADWGNHRVRKVDPQTGILSTVAGNGSARTTGDEGPATEAGVPAPVGLVVDQFGNVLVSTQGSPTPSEPDEPAYFGNRVRSILAVAAPGLSVGGSAPALPGDANGDGSVNVQDAVLALRHLLGFRITGAFNPINADFNGDHQVNLVDVRMILQQTFR